MKSIFVLTGKRGGYGAMRPLLILLRDDPAIDFRLLITDQHLDPRFGETRKEVERDFGDNIVVIEMGDNDGTALGRSRALASFQINLSNYMAVAKNRPEIFVLYGDRTEVLSAAAVCTIMNIKIAHIQGGDLTGSVDEHIRHAVTKLSHIHFPSTTASAKRLLQMGESPDTVFPVGDCHVDEICRSNYKNELEVRNFLEIVDSRLPIAIILQHSETTEGTNNAGLQFEQTLEALEKIELLKIFIYPCSDPGYLEIIERIESQRGMPNTKVFKNLDADIFWGLMAIAHVMIGNSSAGIIEAPYFNLPVVNIGLRQNRRERSENVIDVGYDSNEIRKAIDRSLRWKSNNKTYSKIYGVGEANKNIYATLTSTTLGGVRVLKDFCET